MKAKSKFAEYVERMPLLLERLLSSEALSPAAIKKLKSRGVYCFFEDEKPLYAGRTGDFSKRHTHHCGKSSDHNKAAFAFLLSREATKREKASYRQEGSRKELMRDPIFSVAFADAKVRIRNMGVRFVVITDHNEQHMFELYLSLELGTPYNKFKTT